MALLHCLSQKQEVPGEQPKNLQKDYRPAAHHPKMLITLGFDPQPYGSMYSCENDFLATTSSILSLMSSEKRITQAFHYSGHLFGQKKTQRLCISFGRMKDRTMSSKRTCKAKEPKLLNTPQSPTDPVLLWPARNLRGVLALLPAKCTESLLSWSRTGVKVMKKMYASLLDPQNAIWL